MTPNQRPTKALPAAARLLLCAVGFVVLLLSAQSAHAAAQPGQTVRNSFGTGNTQCGGACGVSCPSSCNEATRYECLAGERLLQVRTYVCGTHQGCRQHDDCLDRCRAQAARLIDCQTRCHAEAIEAHGFEYATSWATGGGPYDADRIVFEYTRRATDAPEPAYRCPDGARYECAGEAARCVGADDRPVAPVFDGYRDGPAGAMRVSGLRTGPLCDGETVCAQSADIRVDARDTCSGAGCTRYGLEFDYSGADPALPLECSASSEGGDGDFVGDLIKGAFDSAPDLGADTFEGNSGLGELLGVFQKVVQSADRPEDVEISMAPLGPDGKPIESQRVGSEPRTGPPPVPRTVDLPAASGHLVVPLYERAGETPGTTVVREIRCTHGGQPVLETTFRLHF